MLATLIAAWPVGRWLGWRGYDAYALEPRNTTIVLLLAGLIAAGLAKLAAVHVGLAIGVYRPAAAEPVAATAILAGLLGGAISTFVPSVAEDILTRGFWLRAAAVRWTGAVFVLATSAIYVLNHIYRLADGPVEWLRLFCFGLAYAAAAWRWRTLWAAVGLHWGWNFTNVWIDYVAPVDAARQNEAVLLSAGVHLVLAAAVFLAPRPERRAENNAARSPD